MTCNEEFATLWDFISSDKDLDSPEKILYAIILSYSSQEGFCWATNAQLMQRMGMGETNDHRFKEHLRGLKDKNWIHIEGSTRNRKIYPLKNPIRGQNDPQLNLVKKRIRGQKRTLLGVKVTPNPPLPLYKEKIKESKLRYRGARDKPDPSVSIDFSEAAKTGLMTGPIPVPGSQEMVAATKEALEGRHQLGNSFFSLADSDLPYFYGFSPRVVKEALDRAHNASKKGERIHNIAAWLFATCARIRQE